jgi:elongation factor G
VSTDAVSGGRMVISGQAPLAEMGDYQSRLKSVTAGEGSYSMEFAGYEPAPSAVQKSLMASFEHPEEE